MSHRSQNHQRQFKRRIAGYGVVALLCTGHAAAQEGCSATIEDPKAGQGVTIEYKVGGTSYSVPPGNFVWVLARQQGVEGWFPQGRVEFTDQSQWNLSVTFGDPEDSGSSFDVRAAVYDKAADRALRKWLEDADRTQNYVPIQAPPPEADKCTASQIAVTRQ